MNELTTINLNFDNTFQIYILFKEDGESYKKLEPSFKIYGLAYIDLKSKSIFLDGENIDNKEEMYFIICHELSHFYLKHKGNYNKFQEAEADYLGILLCLKHNYNDSAKLGMKFFKQRNGINFNEFKEKYHSNIVGRFKI